MRWRIQKIGLLAIILPLILFPLVPFKALALSECSAEINIASVGPMSVNGFEITVTNTGSSDIDWVDITVPQTYFTYSGNSIYDWVTADHIGGTTAIGNSIPVGGQAVFSVAAAADIVSMPPLAWQISTDDAGGANPINCSGTAETAISGSVPNDSNVGLSNLIVSDITTSTATISWVSDYAVSSLVLWGTTSGYGNATNNNLTLEYNHTVVLSGLASGTGYHFQVMGSDGQGSFAYSSDSTFLTAGQSGEPDDNPDTGTGPINIVNNTGSTKKVAEETVLPVVTLNGLGSEVFKIAPTVTGQATDNRLISAVEYSTDGGLNWLPVDPSDGLGSSQASFGFTPAKLKDGTYDILARAIDNSGNVGLSSKLRIIVARVNPLVGGSLFTIGSQVVRPDASGIVNLVSGIDQKVTVSCVGGPVQVYIEASKADKHDSSHLFTLTKSPDTGLWTGVISFNVSGKFDLTAYAVNGAGVQTSRRLNSVQVMPLPNVSDAHTKQIIKALVTLYYYDSQSGSWVVWDGGAYNQTNPQVTNQQGQYKLLIPAGKYYLEVKALGYQDLISRIFETQSTTALSDNLALKPQYEIKLGPWHVATLPNVTAKYVDIMPSDINSHQGQIASALINQQLPAFSLNGTDGKVTNSIDLLGKPTIITFGATWSPTSEEQLAALAELQTNQNINVVPVALQEDIAKVQAHTAVAGLDLTWLVDPDSTLSDSYDIQSLPVHYFVNRRGEIKLLDSGVLTSQQIMDRLESL